MGDSRDKPLLDLYHAILAAQHRCHCKACGGPLSPEEIAYWAWTKHKNTGSGGGICYSCQDTEIIIYTAEEDKRREA